MWLTSGPHRNVASTSAKPGSKTARWSKMNGFKGWMVKDIRFWSSMAKIKPRQELDGQKMDFFLFRKGGKSFAEFLLERKGL